MSNLSPQQFHPHLNDYQSGGMGHVQGDESRSVVGYVPTHILASMPGNHTDSEGVERHRKALRSGEGFKDPVMVVFDGQHAFVGEGNHRVKAAEAEGISHVPTRVVRSYRFNEEDKERGRTAQPITERTHWQGGMGEDYLPSDIHPSHLFSGVL